MGGASSRRMAKKAAEMSVMFALIMILFRVGRNYTGEYYKITWVEMILHVKVSGMREVFKIPLPTSRDRNDTRGIENDKYRNVLRFLSSLKMPGIRTAGRIFLHGRV